MAQTHQLTAGGEHFAACEMACLNSAYLLMSLCVCGSVREKVLDTTSASLCMPIDPSHLFHTLSSMSPMSLSFRHSL